MSDRPLPRWGERAQTVCHRWWRVLGWVVAPLMLLRLVLHLGAGIDTDRWLAERAVVGVLGPLVVVPAVVLVAAAATWAAAVLVSVVRPAGRPDVAR